MYLMLLLSLCTSVPAVPNVDTHSQGLNTQSAATQPSSHQSHSQAAKQPHACRIGSGVTFPFSKSTMTSFCALLTPYKDAPGGSFRWHTTAVLLLCLLKLPCGTCWIIGGTLELLVLASLEVWKCSPYLSYLGARFCVSQLVSQSVGWSVGQSVVSQSVGQSVGQSVSQSVGQTMFSALAVSL